MRRLASHHELDPLVSNSAWCRAICLTDCPTCNQDLSTIPNYAMTKIVVTAINTVAAGVTDIQLTAKLTT
eukprot:3646337-Rhodomonas_salina.1